MLRLSFLVAFLLAGLWSVTALFGPALVADQQRSTGPTLPIPTGLPTMMASQVAPIEAVLEPTAAAQPIAGPTILTDVAPSAAMLELTTPKAQPAALRQSGVSFRQVTARSANVRGAPSLQGDVLGRLSRGDEVVVLQDSGTGWLQIRVEGDGFEGWISQKLLSE